jgi:hypothetical protein
MFACRHGIPRPCILAPGICLSCPLYLHTPRLRALLLGDWSRPGLRPPCPAAAAAPTNEDAAEACIAAIREGEVSDARPLGEGDEILPDPAFPSPLPRGDAAALPAAADGPLGDRLPAAEAAVSTTRPLPLPGLGDNAVGTDAAPASVDAPPIRVEARSDPGTPPAPAPVGVPRAEPRLVAWVSEKLGGRACEARRREAAEGEAALALDMLWRMMAVRLRASSACAGCTCKRHAF